jgi:DNA-binding HxlR family transcriptional regulator
VIVLLDGPARFSDLRRSLPKVSANILTNKLRQLEVDGIVVRGPLTVAGRGYALSPFGYALHPAIDALARWAAKRPPHAGYLTSGVLEQPGG